MAPHSKLGPSSADRWFACPGSVNLIKTLPPDAFAANKYAAEGTVAHAISFELVTGKTDFLELTSRVGEVVMEDGFEVGITDEMIDGAAEYADAIALRRKELTKPIEVKAFAEEQVKASSVDEDVWGTADYVMFQKGHKLFVFDYKFGKGVVSAVENKQMLTYAVGIEDSLAGTVFDEIVLVVVQPRASHEGETVREYRLSSQELQAFREELRRRVAATRHEDAPREAGAWCRFCPAFGVCPEARGMIAGAAREAFDALPNPGQTKEQVKAEGAFLAQKLAPERLAEVLEKEDLIDAFIEACRERALRELTKDASAVPGFKLVEGRANRQWKEGADVAAAFQLLGDRIWREPKLLSPAQMEKIAGKDEVAKYCEKPAGKLTVARADDKRAAVTPAEQAKTAFDAAPIDRVDLGGFGGE